MVFYDYIMQLYSKQVKLHASTVSKVGYYVIVIMLVIRSYMYSYLAFYDIPT